MRSAPEGLTELIRQVVESLEYELVGVEFLQRHKGRSLLRVYIDQPEGINLDDCSEVSHRVSGILDVEDPVKGNYDLEVSSPGLDRPLFSKEHFLRYKGCKVQFELRAKVAGRRRITGILDGLEDDNVLVTEGGERYSLPLDKIDVARLVPEF
jgi:ribosome maturation factor RimP